MNLPFFVAKKYFLSKKKRSFINFISIISMLGIALGLTSLIIILSVFNGLEELNRQIFKAFDPDLKITAIENKGFYPSQMLIQQINKVDGVAFTTEVYQDKALARSKDAQMIVVLKGVDSTFTKNAEMKKSLVDGKMEILNGGRPTAFIGGGVSSILNLNVLDYLTPLGILYPKNQKLNVLAPEDNINQINVEVSGIFVLEQQYDNYVYLPLSTVEQLIEAPGKRTSVEITLKPGAEVGSVKDRIAAILDDSLQIKDRDEQNESLLKAIKIEKLFIFVALFFIIGIASFNIFYALSMLGIVSLGMQYATVDAYPVKIISLDIFLSVLGIFLITFLASILPATKAQKFMLNQKK
jgi:lipoprotein-releasing system permease protein